MTDPIGHLPDEADHQGRRDAAAGPVVGRAPRGQEWPPAYREPHRPGSGGYHPGGIRFKCADCQLVMLSVGQLILHVVTFHRRGPYDRERVPLAPAKPYRP